MAHHYSDDARNSRNPVVNEITREQYKGFLLVYTKREALPPYISEQIEWTLYSVSETFELKYEERHSNCDYLKKIVDLRLDPKASENLCNEVQELSQKLEQLLSEYDNKRILIKKVVGVNDERVKDLRGYDEKPSYCY